MAGKRRLGADTSLGVQATSALSLSSVCVFTASLNAVHLEHFAKHESPEREAQQVGERKKVEKGHTFKETRAHFNGYESKICHDGACIK